MLRAQPNIIGVICLTAWLISFQFNAQLDAAEDAPAIDLSILQERDNLRPFLTPRELVSLLKAEEMIEEGESDIRSGEHLAKTTPSTFDPNQDVGPIRKRGEALVESGREKVRMGQEAVAILLSEVANRKENSTSTADERYNFVPLSVSSIDEAINDGARVVLERCWALGYGNIFFDKVFETTSEGTRPAEASIRNSAYDAFIDIDGTRFSVSVPLHFKYAPSKAGLFTFDNASAYSGEKVALLTVHRISDTERNGDLLVMQALDLNTLIVLVNRLYFIPSGEEGSSPVVSIKDENQTLLKLASLPKPYRFSITTESEDSDFQTSGYFLKHSIVNNSPLQIVDSSFVTQAYTSDDDMLPDGLTNAVLSLTPEDDGYRIDAQAAGTDRTILIGSMMIE